MQKENGQVEKYCIALHPHIYVASANQGYSFAITYINGYGESTISDWGKGVEIPKNLSQSAPIIVSRDPKC